jgi:hypothetical protein
MHPPAVQQQVLYMQHVAGKLNGTAAAAADVLGPMRTATPTSVYNHSGTNRVTDYSGSH